MRIEVQRPCQALGSASAFDSRFCAQALKCDAALNVDTLTRKAQGGKQAAPLGKRAALTVQQRSAAHADRTAEQSLPTWWQP